MPKIKKSPDEVKRERHENVSLTLEESRSWMDIKTIVTVSGVHINFCKHILQQLVDEGIIGQRVQPSVNNRVGTTLYAKTSLVKKYEAQQKAGTEFKDAKSRFQSIPHLRDGIQPKAYISKKNQHASLAMLSRVNY